MTPGLNVNAAIFVIAAAVLLVLAILLFMFLRYKAGKMPSPRESAQGARPNSSDDKPKAVAAPVAKGDVLQELEAAQKALADELRGVVEVLVEREIRAREASGIDERIEALCEVYEKALQSIEPFLDAVQQLQPTVALLKPFAAEAGVAEAIAEYEEITGMGGRLREHSARLRRLQNSGGSAAALAADFHAGNIQPHEYLRAIYASAAPERVNLPSPAEEQARAAELTGTAEERLLNWIDSVSELRNVAVAGAYSEVRDACSRLITHADEIIEAWDIKLIDVKAGSTLYDARLHDLGGSLPRTDVQPETVIGVRRLGHKRNGVVVRKPEVLVAAASAAV